MSPNDMNLVRRLSFSSQNLNSHPGGDSPPELGPSHPSWFLLPRAPNPNTAPPVLYSFFPQSTNHMDPTSPSSDTANPTPSCPPTFAPSQTVNPRSSQLFLQSQEESPASWPADSPPVQKRQCFTTDSEISRRQGLETPARLIEEAKRAEAARISHPGLQIRNPPAQVAKQTPKSDPDDRNIKKSAPSRVRKAKSSKSTASDLFSVAKALGGNRLLDLVCEAYASYVLKDETEGRREPSYQSEVDQN